MLFNSYHFIFLFLPVTLVLFWVLVNRVSSTVTLSWLIFASIVFYGWWNWRYVPILALSTCLNFAIARWIQVRPAEARDRRIALIAGLVFNFGLLGYFKYSGFLTGILADATGLSWQIAAQILPLGISFYSFQQIAYLVDSYRGDARGHRFVEYAAFVTFFPHCIAGPLVHPRELLPQFDRFRRSGRALRRLAPGIGLFAIGLVKKTLLADGIARSANQIFNAAAGGAGLDALHAWFGAFAYTMQLYFDFSAYSDMAAGLALMFGLRLPINFFSPYKATSIIDFWRRWHITLSRFLKFYLYIPLGGNRHGPARRYINLLITMLLGGLWHGAAWTFVVWGGLHGFYLVVNHLWRRTAFAIQPQSIGLKFFYGGLTFFAVTIAWVFFRAADLPTAFKILLAMIGMGQNAVSLPLPTVFDSMLLLLLGAIAFLVPNSAQIFSRFSAYCNRHEIEDLIVFSRVTWRLHWRWAMASGVVLAIGIMAITQDSEFLYFDF